MTPEMTDAPPVVAISVSESPDMHVFGLSSEHLQDAMVEIALQLLSSGTSLAYGGDLHRHGFAELLFELIGRYKGHPRHGGTITVTNYLAWPVHIRMTADALEEFSAGHKAAAHLVFLGRDGTCLEPKQRLKLQTHEPDNDEWSEGLTAMRTTMRRETQARVVLGGRVEGYKGRMPGIAEETLLSLEAEQPIFLIGGFGGCCRDIAETLGLVEPWAGSRPCWGGRSCFEKYSAVDLHNGLSDEENIILAGTPHIQQAVTLVYRGLRKTLGRSTLQRGK